MAAPLPVCTSETGSHSGPSDPPLHSCPRHGLDSRAQSKAQKKPRKGRGYFSPTASREEKLERWRFIKRCFMAAYPRCFKCGRTEGNGYVLDLDHIKPAGRGGEWEPENAWLLCRQVGGTEGCHPEKHGVPQWSRA